MPDGLEALGIREGERKEPATYDLGGGHQITGKALDQLIQYHKRPADAMREAALQHLLPLVPVAHAAWHANRILCTNYEFAARNGGDTLWYVPNERSGITIMLPKEQHRLLR